MKSNLLKVISVIEIAGGILGIVSASWAMYKFHENLGWYMLLFIPFLFLFGLSIVAGLFLWQNKRKGFIFSIIIQAIQIPQVALGGFLFYFCSGLDLSSRLLFHDSGGSFKFNFYFGGDFELNYDPQSTIIMLGINVFASVAFLYLLKKRNEV